MYEKFLLCEKLSALTHDDFVGKDIKNVYEQQTQVKDYKNSFDNFGLLKINFVLYLESLNCYDLNFGVAKKNIERSDSLPNIYISTWS